MRVLFPIVLVLSMALLFLPMRAGPVPLPDKVYHLLMFAALAGNGVLAEFRRGWLIAGLMAYGVGTEVVQYLLPFHRMADYADALANFAGIVVGLVAGHLTKRALTSVLPA